VARPEPRKAHPLTEPNNGRWTDWKLGEDAKTAFHSRKETGMAKTCFIAGTSSGFDCQLNELPLERGEKTIPSVTSLCSSAFKSDAAPPCGAPISLDEGHRLRRAIHSFFRAVRVFLTGPSFAFQEVSLGREVSVVFTSNGPLIYRWEANKQE
jgi:hypothetical protein